jgi:hypothetical protein
MDHIDPKKLSLPVKKVQLALQSKQPPRHKRGEKFLKGPIPMNWLYKAGQLSGKALQVALAIWFLAGMHNSREIKISGPAVANFGVNRHAYYRGLNMLEHADLVSVRRGSGRKALVTILDISEDLHKKSDA